MRRTTNRKRPVTAALTPSEWFDLFILKTIYSKETIEYMLKYMKVRLKSQSKKKATKEDNSIE